MTNSQYEAVARIVNSLLVDAPPVLTKLTREALASNFPDCNWHIANATTITAICPTANPPADR